MVQISASRPPALSLDELVRGLEHLPSAPRVLPRLKQLLRDGNSSMHQVVELVRLDPGIAARVLQFGNSAYFSRGLRCYTVDEAVNRVGYEQIYELVATAVASQVLERPLAVYAMDADALWHNAIACALAAEALADRIQADRNVAYTIGLLHGIGMVAIDDWAARNQPALRLVSQGLPLEFVESERAALGYHHAEAGAALLRLWEFPPVMTEPVRWQYLPNGTAVHFQLAALLHVAKWIRSAVLDPSGSRPPSIAHLLGRMGLTPLHLNQLVEMVRARLKSIRLQLDLDQHLVSVRFPGGNRAIPQGGSGLGA